MAERSGLVALDQEVSDPGKSIGHHRPEQRIPGMANGKSHNQRKQPQQGACGVHGAIARVAVLLQIEGEEIFVAGKFLFGNGLSFLLGLIAYRLPLIQGNGVSGEFYYALRTNWFLPAAESGAPAMRGNACRFGRLLDLDRVAQGNSAPHARIHYACLREVRAAQANVAHIGF
jgi:hypothetical protein